MSQAMSVRRQVNETLLEGRRVSVNDLIIKASALALVKHPRFNASPDGDRLLMHDDLNIGIAVALEQGLIIPSISRCQDRSLVEIARASSDLVRRTQENRLRAEEYSGSTFSISNLGMHDVDSFAAIILPSQCGGPGCGCGEGAASGAGWANCGRPGDEGHALSGPPGCRWS